MNVLSRAVCAATLIAVTVIVTGCGETFRQVARPEPVPGGNPSGTETEVVLNQCPSGFTCIDNSGTATSSMITAINVSGDTETPGNKSLQNRVGSVVGPAASPTGLVLNADGTVTLTTTAAPTFAAGNGVTLVGAINSNYNGFYFVETVTPFPAGTVYQLIPQFVIPAGTAASGGGTAFLNQFSSRPIAFDSTRTSVFTANTSTDSVSRVSLAVSTAGFAANTSTITLPSGAAPVGISFQYFGVPYTQEYVLNSGATPVCPTGGSLSVINLATTTLTSAVCLEAGADPVDAWIYQDLKKVFVLDFKQDAVYVVDVNPADSGTPKLTTTFLLPAGSGPFKAAQSNDGLFVYVLNANGTISIIDGQAESLLPNPVPTHITANADADPLTNSTPIDMTQDTNFNDTSANSQINHIWILHANGTVSVFDGTDVATSHTLTWITSLATITPAQAGAGAFPTNLVLQRLNSASTGSPWAYVGLGNTDQIVAIDSSKLSRGVVTANATTPVTVGVHRTITTAQGAETTTPTVTSVGISRQGNSSQLSKAYATTVTSTTFNYPDGSSATFPNLYNGTTIVAADDVSGGAPGLNHPVNTVITTAPDGTPGVLPAPPVATCVVGTAFDAQKNCPEMIPVLALGRN